MKLLFQVEASCKLAVINYKLINIKGLSMTCMPFRTTRMHPFVVIFDIAIVCTLQNYLHTMSLNSVIRMVVPKNRTPRVLHNHTGHLGPENVKKN